MPRVTHGGLGRMFRWGGEAGQGWPLVRRIVAAVDGSEPWPSDERLIDVPPVPLDAAFLHQVESVVGAAPGVDDERRLRASRGLATEDLVRARLGEIATVPAAVVSPASHEQVAALLALCLRAGVSVVARGGGTSVTGAVTPTAGSMVLDMTSRMATVLSLSPGDGLVTAQAGILGPALESSAASMRRTVGHFPQSFERSTLGGWIAARSVGQLSSRYGRADELVVGLRALCPEGELRVPPRPASAVGADLIQLLAGSEGGLAIITEATVRTLPAHGRRYLSAWLTPAFEVGLSLARELAAEGCAPAALRLSDAHETALALGEVGRPGVLARAARIAVERRMALLIVAAEGPPDQLALVARRVRGAALSRRALPLGPWPARHWWRDRFRQPQLRDLLLDEGVLTDTWETSAPWSAVAGVCSQVRQVLAAMGAHVLVHVSHVYPEGAAIYFTVFVAARPADAIARLCALRGAVAQAFVQRALPLSHQHGAGKLLAVEASQALGPTARRALAGIKRAMDPQGILNPGLLLDRDALS